MKPLLLFLALMSFSLHAQSVQKYNKPLPHISASGKIKMPDGKVIQIENFSNTEGAVFFVVRHAEKDTAGGANADLNPIGRGRAMALTKMLKKISFDGIFSTDRPRTKHTAEPVAKAKHQEVRIYDAKKQKDLLSGLIAQKGKFLIVGHSNTVPLIVNILMGNEQEKEFSESDYSRLYIVTTSKLGEAKLLLIRF